MSAARDGRTEDDRQRLQRDAWCRRVTQVRREARLAWRKCETFPICSKTKRATVIQVIQDVLLLKSVHVCALVLSPSPLRRPLASALSSRAFRPFTVFLPVSFGPAVSLSEPTAQKEPSFSPPLITQKLTSRGHDPT